MIKTVTAVVCISFAMPCINGCTVSAPLEDLAYERTVVTKSDEPVIVILTTGAVEGTGYTYVVPGTYMPMDVEVPSEYEFNPRDQREFLDFLAAELTRIGLFHAFTDPSKNPTPRYVLDLFFEKTHYNSWGTYTLDVSVQLREGDDLLMSQVYNLKEKRTFKNTMWYGDPGITKNRIANILLDQIISDADAWAAGGVATVSE